MICVHAATVRQNYLGQYRQIPRGDMSELTLLTSGAASDLSAILTPDIYIYGVAILDKSLAAEGTPKHESFPRSRRSR